MCVHEAKICVLHGKRVHNDGLWRLYNKIYSVACRESRRRQALLAEVLNKSQKLSKLEPQNSHNYCEAQRYVLWLNSMLLTLIKRRENSRQLKYL